MSAKWPIPIEASEAVPEGTVYFLPEDVKQAMEMAARASEEYYAGRITLDAFMQVHQAAKRTIEKAAQEKRIGAITGLKI